MMSMETCTKIEIAEEFMAIKRLFDKIGFEVVGSKKDYDTKLYVVKKKKD